MSSADPLDRSIPLNEALIRQMATSWPKRATIRSELYSFGGSVYAEPERPDYPLALVPFREHPRFLAASPEQQQQCLTWGWLVYNERTITVEEYIVNPSLTMIMHDVFPGAGDIHLKKSVQQCLIDEHFHTYMHLAAIDDTRRLRRISGQLNAPPAVTYRRLLESQANVTDPTERAMLALAFGVVAEVSIKGYLNLLAEDSQIQPAHKTVALLHNRDESAHGQLLGEVTKVLWTRMNAPERRYFVQVLPLALEAFVIQDFSAWKAILEHVDLPGREEIIADAESERSVRTLVRDVSGIKRLAGELDILGELSFDFLPVGPR